MYSVCLNSVVLIVLLVIEIGSSHQNQSSSCVLPPKPNFGEWEVFGQEKSPGDTVDPGTIIKVTCDVHRKFLTQSTAIFCLANGKWNKEVPRCVHPLNCGNKVLSKPSGARALVYGGRILNEIKYPWIAAIYQYKEGEFINQCGGSIISKTMILTAAHCVANAVGEAFPVNQFNIGVGKLRRRYRDDSDLHAQYLDVKTLVVHPAYRADHGHYYADIALVITYRKIIMSDLVQAVCIMQLTDLTLNPGDRGEIAGWGVTEFGFPSDKLRYLSIPYKSQTQCIQELPTDFTSSYNMTGKLCAGIHNQNASVCIGDSGSGLVFKNPNNNLYYIHGVVSIAPESETGDVCNYVQNTLYTKVAYFYDWILDQINTYDTKYWYLSGHNLKYSFVN